MGQDWLYNDIELMKGTEDRFKISLTSFSRGNESKPEFCFYSHDRQEIIHKIQFSLRDNSTEKVNAASSLK
jgi:hypothetical protein